MTTLALSPDRIYLAFDRFVCGRVHCAGITAMVSGRTIDGALLTAATHADAQEWADAGLGKITCECGAVSHGVLTMP